MSKLKPRCIDRCNECFFYYIDECITPPGENYFIPISEKQASLIIKNKSRFILSQNLSKKLKDRFPSLATSYDS